MHYHFQKEVKHIYFPSVALSILATFSCLLATLSPLYMRENLSFSLDYMHMFLLFASAPLTAPKSKF